MSLSTKQIRPQHTPHLFFLEDPLNPGVFNQVNEDIDPIPVDFPNALKVLKKKAFDGHVYIAIHNTRSDIWWQKDVDVNPILVAQSQLVGNVETSPGNWTADQAFNFGAANLSKIDNHYVGYIKKDIGPYSDVVFGQIWNFEHGNQEQDFYLDVPGEKVKMTWQARVLKAAIANLENDNNGLSFNADKYSGNVTHSSEADPDPDWTIHRWTFEEDGFQCPDADARTPLERFQDKTGLWVDPYISVDEQASEITVESTGLFELTFSSDNGWAIDEWYDLVVDSGKTQNLVVHEWASFLDIFLVDDTGTIQTDFASDNTAVVVEDTPLRTVVKVSGLMSRAHNTAGESDYPLVMDYTIYADGKIFIRTQITNSSGGNVTMGAATNLGIEIGHHNSRTEFIIDWDGFSDTTYSAGENWGGFLGDATGSPAVKACHYCALVQYTNTDQALELMGAFGSYNFYWRVWGTWTWTNAATIDIVTFHHIGLDNDYWDSGDNDTFDHTVAGNWETWVRDFDMAEPTGTGGWVKGLTDPLTIGADGFASDGAWHINGE